MREVDFSIIIPCYNGAQYLEASFSSLADQSFKNFEYIFIDDNSTDSSFEIAKQLDKKYGLNGILIQKDESYKKGVSASRNLGLEKSSGKWIVFLDCDDYFLPEKMQCLYDFIQNNPEASAIHHAYRRFDSITGEERDIVAAKNSDHNLNFLLLDNPIGTSTVAVKKDVLIKLGGFSEKLQGIEDYYLWCRIANLYEKWYYLSDVLTMYRYLPDSLMSQRQLSYYVGQVNSFYEEAKLSSEFNKIQLRSMYEKTFFEQLNYRVDISLKYYGVSDFLKGLILLSKLGRRRAAIFHLKQRLKNQSLYMATTMIDKLSNKRPS